MEPQRWILGVSCCALPIASAYGQSPCSSLPGSLIEIGVPASPDYIGVQFKYLQGTQTFDLTRAGGIAIGDYNDDGYDDFLFPGGVNQPMALGENLQNGKFVDVAIAKGLGLTWHKSGSATFFDYDNDGDLDILSVAHPTGAANQIFLLYRNSGAAGNHVFYPVNLIATFPQDPGTVEPSLQGVVGGVTVGDCNGDGFLDVFVTWWNAGITNPSNDMWRLYSNEPNPDSATNDPTNASQTPRIFVDRTVAAGLNIDLDSIPDLDGGPIGGDSWQPTFVDLDNDGFVDLHVCVDFGGDFMFMNNRNGTFTDVATPIGMNGNPRQVRHEMGACFADVDNDGDLDVQLTNLANGMDSSQADPKVYQDRFYRNDSSLGRLRFVDMGPVTGVFNSEYGWGTIAFDYENDGDLDHATVSGNRLIDDPFLNRLHINGFPAKAIDGVSPLYCDATGFLPGFSHAPNGDDVSRNIAAMDFDNDGDLDLIVGKSRDTTAAIPIKRNEFYRNTQAVGNDRVDLDLVGIAGSLNVTNARVWLRTAGLTKHKQVLNGTSFHVMESARQHFGLGPPAVSAVKWVVVRWPGSMGGYQYFANVLPNQVNSLQRTAHNDLGDLDVNGKIDMKDVLMLVLLVTNPVTYDQLYPDSPGLVLGDMDGDNAHTFADVKALLERHGHQKL